MTTNQVLCEGWWEQSHYGRQPMTGLVLWFDGPRVGGSGTDIIGDFDFSGTIRGEQVRLIKRYHGAHSVDYIGTYDGEGSMQGVWVIGIPGGHWRIRIVRRLVGDESRTESIPEWTP